MLRLMPGDACFFSDEPVVRGGLFEHPTPAEYIISAISGCSVTHIEKFCREIGMPIDECHVDARLNMARLVPDDERGRNGGIMGIELVITVTSSGAEDKFKSVKALFRKGVRHVFVRKKR